MFWHAKGWTLFQTLIAYMRRRLVEAGYQEVNSPRHDGEALLGASGHWENYREMMFVTELPDERVFCCKPMNCPGHVQIFKHGLKSYRDLPLKIGEFGKVHRYEPSGAMHGLLRVRHFTQDDAHIFITEDQLQAQCLEVNDLLLSIYEDFGFKDVVVKLSTRPDEARRRRTRSGTTPRPSWPRCSMRSSGAARASIKTASIRARAPSTARSSSTC